MKNLMLLLLCLTGCANPANPYKPLAKFPANPSFLIAGQSNSVSPSQGTIAPYESTTGLITVNDYYHGGDFFSPNHARPIDSSITWMYMAELMKRPVFINNVGRGNTSSRDWNNGLWTRINTALSQKHYDAILWIQGESDSTWGLNISEQETYDNLAFVIQMSHQAQPDIEWYIALDSFTGLADNNPTRRAEKRIIADHLALQGPDADSLRVNQKWLTYEGAEFAGDGLIELGRLWYESLKERL